MTVDPSFEPIAIVGRGCVLPGAHTPEALWEAVLAGRDLIGDVPADSWRIPPRVLLDALNGPGSEGIRTHRGGFVTDFENHFDPTGLALPAERLANLDPVCRWTLHAARRALEEAVGVDPAVDRVGFILGNLSYPSRGLTDYALEVWRRSKNPGAPENRFNSGFPAHITARALGLTGESFALDAACASSLYALALACERLSSGATDAMLVGGVNAADPMMIFMGFTQLQALSPSGRSRPFHKGADGLLPAEGAVCVVLKTVRRAVRDGDRILGVIRGIGLSNDGRGGSLLAPDRTGQERAMAAAYAVSGIDPATIGLVECHATGTAVGDGIEIASMNTFFGHLPDLPIGSLKSNLGHLITASGLASLLKVLGAMEAGLLPPTLHVESPLDALAATPLRPIRRAEPCPEPADGPRRAAINNFGFGGNNAHLIVEAWSPDHRAASTPSVADDGDIAICGIEVMTSRAIGFNPFSKGLFEAEPTDGPPGSMAGITLPLEGLTVPPRDLERSLPQQTAILAAAINAMSGVTPVAGERAGVLVGMGCDAEVVRYSGRWLTPATETATREAIIPALDAAGTVGHMPNMPANRINAHFDWRGIGFTLSSEELSGLDALAVAGRFLRRRELDLVLVGAVDMAREPVQERAGQELFPADRRQPGDGAVALVLKRLDDARAAGDAILARLPAGTTVPSPVFAVDAARGASPVTRRFGHAHAASGLLHVAAAVAACVNRRLPGEDRAAFWLSEAGKPPLGVQVRSFTGRSAETVLTPGEGSFIRPVDITPPRLHLLAASDRRQLLAILESDPEPGKIGDGPVRMAWVATTPGESQACRRQAMDFLAGRATDTGGPPSGIYFRERPLDGELAFVFTGAAAAYGRMGALLQRAFPEMLTELAARHPGLDDIVGLVHDQPWEGDAGGVDPFKQLKGCALLCQEHAWIAHHRLGLKPRAALGLSSGESNALFAFGVWNDMRAMFQEIEDSRMYGHWLTGACESAARAWNLPDGQRPAWRNWRILAPVATVREVLADHEHVALTIIQSPGDCCIGGDETACRQVIREIGTGRAFPLGQDMVVHCAELAPVADMWEKIHRRRVGPVPAIRFYGNGSNGHYRPTAEAAAAAILRQALEPVDFSKTVQNAWRDGVRIFVEMGPRNALTHAIGQTLGDRPHLALAMDDHRRDDLSQLADTTAQLFVAGAEMDPAPLLARFSDDAATGPATVQKEPLVLRLPGHRPAVPRLQPPVDNGGQPQRSHPGPVQSMPPAPAMPSVTSLAPVPPWEAPPPAQPAPEQRVPAVGSTPAQRILATIRQQQDHFLASQVRVHQQFLDLQGEIAKRYLAAATPIDGHAVPVTTPVPEPPPTPAVDNTEKPSVTDDATPRGRTFNRAELEVLASGKISSIFGTQFKKQDGFSRQVRLPEPPLLLVDRVTGLAGEPGGMGKGTIWTETDVDNHDWCLHHGRTSLGTLIESGQSDLLLISWLGIDFHNRGERIYRLLGCECTFHDTGLPRAGDTLRYDIHVDGHARSGDVRLFFFHYDCRVGDRLHLSVRHGQAGFFSDEELANSGGVLWSAEETEPTADARLDPPPGPSSKRAFSEAELAAFVEGRAYDCFGSGFERTAPHQRTATIAGGRMKLLDRITEFDPGGGPWKRGYLRAESHVPVDAWFYRGHFKNDPCMPGTLMADAAIQALAVHMAALGFTVERDGWRFEPVPEEPFTFICRGQVIPDAPHDLRYEVFVDEIIDGPEPVVYAALLCTSDDLKVFLCPRFGLRLVPDWPLATWRDRLIPEMKPHLVDPDRTVRGDFNALLACAWGAPSEAFGPVYADYDSPRRMPRLPGPPYHFMSRILSVDCPAGEPTPGGRLSVLYRIPDADPYFDQHSHAVVPFAVLLEAMLQPCGWLAMYMGLGRHVTEDLSFRNLDGKGCVMRRELPPGCGELRSDVTLIRFSRAGDTVLTFFRVDAFLDDRPVMSFETAFGFFTGHQLANQAGLPTTDPQRQRMGEAGDCAIDLEGPAPELPPGPVLASGDYRMIDTITLYQPDGGEPGLGRIRGRQRIRPQAWYFKAHFFQDPVQPGSLGLEALIQLLQTFMRLKGLHEGLPEPRFQSLALERPFDWSYRGQVLPTNREVITELTVTAVERREGRVVAVAAGSLWVDGLRIYSVENLAVAVLPGTDDGTAGMVHALSLENDPWLHDHCPTYVVPAVPMMVLIDYMARAAGKRIPGQTIVALEDIRVHRWTPVPPWGAIRLRSEARRLEPHRAGVKLFHLDETAPDGSPALVAEGGVRFAERHPPPPEPLPPLKDGHPIDDPYESRALFHGPAFKVMSDLQRGVDGASFHLDAGGGAGPTGLLNPVLLDGILHGVPRDEPHIWFPGALQGHVSFPHRIERLTLHAEPPRQGRLTGEVRAVGRDGRHLRFVAQWLLDRRPLMEMHFTEIMLPKGFMARATPAQRADFLERGLAVPGIALSRLDGERTTLNASAILSNNWLPGTLEAIFAVNGSVPEMARAIAIKEHVAAKMAVHPREVVLDGDRVSLARAPLNRFPLEVQRQGRTVTVGDIPGEHLDWHQIRDDWRRRLAIGRPWSGEAIFLGLLRQFVGRVILADPRALAATRGRPVLFLANHQVGVESPLFAILAPVLIGTEVKTLAKVEHRRSWLGTLIERCRDYPLAPADRDIFYFDREDQASLFERLTEIKRAIHERGASLLVHAAGTRSTRCREPVTRISGVILDLALSEGLPIVPVRFSGGLPVEPGSDRLEFPLGFAKQDIYLGAPLDPRSLTALPLGERKARILSALNGPGPDLMMERPNAPDETFRQRVATLVEETGLNPTRATVLQAMIDYPDPDPEVDILLRALQGGGTISGEGDIDNWLHRLREWFVG